MYKSNLLLLGLVGYCCNISASDRLLQIPLDQPDEFTKELFCTSEAAIVSAGAVSHYENQDHSGKGLGTSRKTAENVLLVDESTGERFTQGSLHHSLRTLGIDKAFAGSSEEAVYRLILNRCRKTPFDWIQEPQLTASELSDFQSDIKNSEPCYHKADSLADLAMGYYHHGDSPSSIKRRMSEILGNDKLGRNFYDAMLQSEESFYRLLEKFADGCA